MQRKRKSAHSFLPNCYSFRVKKPKFSVFLLSSICGKRLWVVTFFYFIPDTPEKSFLAPIPSWSNPRKRRRRKQRQRPFSTSTKKFDFFLVPVTSLPYLEIPDPQILLLFLLLLFFLVCHPVFDGFPGNEQSAAEYEFEQQKSHRHHLCRKKGNKNTSHSFTGDFSKYGDKKLLFPCSLFTTATPDEDKFLQTWSLRQCWNAASSPHCLGVQMSKQLTS